MSHTIRNTFTNIHGLRKANKSSSAHPPLYLLHAVSYLPIFSIRCLRSVHYLALLWKIWLDSNSEIENQSGFACLFPLVLIAGFLIKLNRRSPSPISLSQSLWKLILREITITRLLAMSMFDETEAVFKLKNKYILIHIWLCMYVYAGFIFNMLLKTIRDIIKGAERQTLHLLTVLLHRHSV